MAPGLDEAAMLARMASVPPTERRVAHSSAYRFALAFVRLVQIVALRLSAHESRKARVMKLLHVDSGILGAGSVSRRLSAIAVAQWRDQHPETSMVYRDLVSDPVDHLTGELLAAKNADPSQHSPAVRQALTVGKKVLDEFLAADVVVVGAPMYNFGIPSQLKAWIDRIAVAGKTFAYSEKGPVGLAGGKTVIIASSRGNFYGPNSPLNAVDHQEKYLNAVFAFFGITDIRFLRAEGVNVSAAQRQKAIAEAESEVVQLLAA
jgi:FMN-dependent NADH-azoreductase